MSPRGRVFTYEEALDTFPVVRDRTALAVRQIEAMVNTMQSREELDQKKQELDGAVQTIIDAWVEDMVALGCEVKGLWLVDWDNGDGYYCWKFPEESIGHFHTYEDGYEGRLPLN